ncbi:MAG: ABC transporter permease subunit [Phycisphaerae bacterium]|nr:ABC transporter permease subunit [Phycisphaerae bacterium]
MPIIPVVGRKSPGVRALIASIYVFLTIGAITMVYPFMLMISTATTGNADWREFRLIPRYWFDQGERFRKYVLDKDEIKWTAYAYQHEEWFSPFDVEAGQFQKLMQTPGGTLERIDSDYQQFISETDPDIIHLNFLHFEQRTHSVLSLRPEYFKWVSGKYNGDLDRVNQLYEDTAGKWDELGIPRAFKAVRESEPLQQRHVDWREFVLSRPYYKQKLISLDCLTFLAVRHVYGTIDLLNREHGTSFKEMGDVRWETVNQYDWGRQIRERILRKDIPLEQLRLKPSASSAFETFVARNALGPNIPFTVKAPDENMPRIAWMRFVRSEECELRYFDPIDPQRLWREFLNRRYGGLEGVNEAHGAAYSSLDDIRLPTQIVDYAAFSRNERTIFLKFLFGNFAMVIDFILIHGRALTNTLILIVLTILTTLTVNPMAAYVLSRFRLRYSHHILVFLLATMAFPAEVAMIPNFLLIKSFPLGALIVGASALIMFLVVRHLVKWKLPLFWSILLGAVIAAAAGWYVPPVLAGVLGREDLNVSLMNTFFALVLPGIASGFSIFLLKGFFDSLPPELYEAGMLDGASETRMFFAITLPLCKPVLAVIALGAFTGAYGAFMFAFLTCQNPKMWTLMVFLYQFQQTYSVPLVMASLVVSAIPTLIMFIFCQNIILRGIVIPTFK